MRKKIPTNSLRGKRKPALANHELVVVAAFLVGAQHSSVDTEDIAMKANELAPGRFSWRKYLDQVNIDTVRKRLWDATKPEKGAYLIGSEKSGWRITKAGFDFAKKQMTRLNGDDEQRRRKSRNESVTETREINRMLDETAFLKFRNNQRDSINKSEAERFFRVDDYVVGAARQAKIERFRIIASGSKELQAAIKFISALLEAK